MTSLVADIMNVQARGDKDGAGEMLSRLAVLSEHVKSSLDKLQSLHIPVDIESLLLIQ